MVDATILRRIAAKTGLGVNYVSKDEKISILLEKLRDLIPDIVLKGGTAVNRVYLSKLGVSRFSEDIDIDFVANFSLDKKIKYLKDKIRGIEGFNIPNARLLHRTLRFDCYYINELGQKDRIMLEFYLTTTKWRKINEVLVKSPFIETHSVIFKVYSLEDLIARKLIALHNRLEGKDMYDLFYLLDFKVNREGLFEILHDLLAFFKINEKDFKKKLLLQLEKAIGQAIYIRDSTNHFIPRTLRPDWNIFLATLKSKIEKLLAKLILKII